MNNFGRAEAQWLEPIEEKVYGECKHCGCDIYGGESIVMFDHDGFCDADCVVEYLIETGNVQELEDSTVVYDHDTYADADALGKFLLSEGDIEEITVGE